MELDYSSLKDYLNNMANIISEQGKTIKKLQD